jgi:hypothetical protein
MKRAALILFLMLLVQCVSFAEPETRITYDGIMESARSEEDNSDISEVLFDDFCSTYEMLCESWDSTWNTQDVILVSEADGETCLIIDGVTITCGSEGFHPVRQVSVLAGSTSTDYSKTVKTAALIAALEYDIPETSSEKKALLATVLDDLKDSLYWLSLIASSPEEGDEIQARMSDGIIYFWRYNDGAFYLVAKL